ncbi:hypothetical protein BC830DRAFT_1088733 [Chytriomyces sp. MP71]|nr:hypothetical protein BC830DRAFT_1088733 [Chytriomyces sp. MP71]
MALEPDPPHRGQYATITIVANLLKEIEEGSKLRVYVIHEGSASPDRPCIAAKHA